MSYQKTKLVTRKVFKVGKNILLVCYGIIKYTNIYYVQLCWSDKKGFSRAALIVMLHYQIFSKGIFQAL